MSNLIKSKQSFSEGDVPSALSKLTLFERSALLQRLETHADHVRIIEAPALYGKSVLAYQYVTRVSEVKRTCWIDASKTMFLNALEKRELLQKLCQALTGSELVVFDALPRLAKNSEAVFSFVLGFLLHQKCEIIITCRTKPALYGSDAKSLVLTTKDLLLSKSEIKRLEKTSEDKLNSVKNPLLGSGTIESDTQLTIVQNALIDFKDKSLLASIPFVCFYPERNQGLFVNYLAERTNNSEEELLEVLLLIMQQGAKAELSQIFTTSFLNSFQKACKVLPHLGAKLKAATFSTLPLPVVARCLLVRRNLEALSEHSVFTTKEEFLFKLIDVLVSYDQFKFAFQLARDLLPKDDQLLVFRAHAAHVGRCGYAQEVVDLAERIGESYLETERDLLLFAQALQDTGNTQYSSMLLGRISDLYAKRTHLFKTKDAQSDVKDFSIDILQGFHVTHLGEPFPQNGNIKGKARMLLTLLVINHKRELSRKWLSRVLWPDSTDEKSKQNFYNLWCYTRRLFERSKGNCPYFIADRYSIQLNKQYVSSDLITLEGLCNDLINNRKPAMGYEGCLEWLEGVGMNELMPGVRCPEIEAQGRVLRNRLVDALLSASELMLRQNHDSLSLRFAQKAYLCDKTREDSCYILMQMFKTVGQYSKAISTFMAHRSMMIKRYGVESSKRIGSLYEEILKEMA